MLPLRIFCKALLVCGLLAAIEPQLARAAFGITSAVGANELPGPPAPDVLPGGYEAALPVIFPEVINGVVTPTVSHPLGLDVDHDGTDVVAAPTISGNVVNPALMDTTIPVGTGFNSYLLHFNPVGQPFSAFYVATINFDNPIIGVQLFSNGFLLEKPAGTAYLGTLEQGDGQVAQNGGPPTTYYPGGVATRGVEEDAFILAIAGNTIILSGSSSDAEIDQIRILTAPTISGAVPEPATALTWALVAITFCSACGRRRQLDLC